MEALTGDEARTADEAPMEDEVRAALGLTEVPGVGCRRFRSLVEEHGSALAALSAVRAGAALPGWPVETAKAARRARPVPSRRIRELAERGIRVVSYGQTAYPDRLGVLESPPPVLYLRGPLSLPETRAVTMVGTREATAYGRRMARDLAGGFARAGWTVVSGLARGIDGASHRGALEVGGRTVGVVGHGLDHLFPASHRRLFARMAEAGLVVSEFAPDEPPHRRHFPRRNRLLAALPDAVVVVQAGRKSGALITADLALERTGREVYAVPGPVGPEASVGVHQLLRDGAGLATCAGDVLADLGFRTGPVRRAAAGVSRDRLARLLGARAHAGAALCRALADGPMSTDALVAEGAVAPAVAPGLLGRLELEGILRRRPGDRWELRPQGPGRSGTSVTAGA